MILLFFLLQKPNSSTVLDASVIRKQIWLTQTIIVQGGSVLKWQTRIEAQQTYLLASSGNQVSVQELIILEIATHAHYTNWFCTFKGRFNNSYGGSTTADSSWHMLPTLLQTFDHVWLPVTSYQEITCTLPKLCY